MKRPLAQVQVSRSFFAYRRVAKPGGDLLMLAPAAWPYRPGEKAMTRFDATAMNRLCQWIAGPGQAEVNYHGLRPTNIDELAFSAAKVERI